MSKSLDAVLREVASLPAPPLAADFRMWVDKYPEFKYEITEYVTAWVEEVAFVSPHRLN